MLHAFYNDGPEYSEIKLHSDPISHTIEKLRRQGQAL